MGNSMNFYENRILPHIIDKACSMGQVMKQRAQVVPLARGVVLEVDMGSGINLPLYNLYLPKAPRIAGYIYKGRAIKPAAA